MRKLTDGIMLGIYLAERRSLPGVFVVLNYRQMYPVSGSPGRVASSSQRRGHQPFAVLCESFASCSSNEGAASKVAVRVLFRFFNAGMEFGAFDWEEVTANPSCLSMVSSPSSFRFAGVTWTIFTCAFLSVSFFVTDIAEEWK